MIALTADHIISISSVIIALSAFILSIRQAKSTEKHNRLSLTPNLCITYVFKQDTLEFNADIENTGIGPAIIHDVIAEVDGKALPRGSINWIEIFDALKFPGNVGVMNLGNEFIQPNKKYSLVALQSVDPTYSKNEMLKVIQRIKITIHYQSVYGDKFETQFDSLPLT